MRTPWYERVLHWFGAGAIAAAATLVTIQIGADIFAGTNGFEVSLEHALAVSYALRLSVAPISALICYILLRAAGERKHAGSLALMSGAGAYLAFEILRIFGFQIPTTYFIVAFIGGTWCALVGLIMGELVAESTRWGLAAFTFLVALLLAPAIVKPLTQWENEHLREALATELKASVHFTPYVPAEASIGPIIQRGDHNVPTVAFAMDQFSFVFENEVTAGQRNSVQPPDTCNLQQMYEAMNNTGPWQDVYDNRQPYVHSCKLIAKTPKGRLIYGEVPPGEGTRTFYIRIGNTNVIVRTATVYAEQIGGGFPEYLTKMVDALNPHDPQKLPVDDSY